VPRTIIASYKPLGTNWQLHTHPYQSREQHNTHTHTPYRNAHRTIFAARKGALLALLHRQLLQSQQPTVRSRAHLAPAKFFQSFIYLFFTLQVSETQRRIPCLCISLVHVRDHLVSSGFPMSRPPAPPPLTNTTKHTNAEALAHVHAHMHIRTRTKTQTHAHVRVCT